MTFAPPSARAAMGFALACLLLPVCAPAAVAAAETVSQEAAPESPVISAGRFEQLPEGELLLTGDVDLRYGELRLLADRVRYNDTTHMVRAEGNVVMMFGKSQISGDRLEMNVETRLATVWNAHGYMDPDVIFSAARLERIADDKVVIIDGTVTTCTQPTPYWSFHVSKATLHIDHYAHMRNVALKAGKAPLVYLPYLVWPMKRDRASGLLLPNLGYSRRRGSFIGNALYLVLGRSQDVTLFFDKYGQSGTGLGYDYRFVPSEKGAGTFTGYYLNDTVDDPNMPGTRTERTRYRFSFKQSQRFDNGYRFLADLNAVSDLDYYLDFERDITQTTSPTVFSHIDLVRNWSNYALNFRADRQEQFISSSTELTLQRLPEMELRGRGIRFGRSPFYLSFQTSAGLFNRNQSFDDPVFGPYSREVTYQRVDLYPTITASFSPTPWLDISPSVSGRETLYSRTVQDPSDATSISLGENALRQFAAFNLSFVGPRFFRVFGDPTRTDTSSYKHTFEPQVTYSFIPKVRGDENIIRFDEVDSLPGDIHKVVYSLTSRLLRKKGTGRDETPSAAKPDEYAADITGPTQVQVPVTELQDLPDEIKEALKDEQRAPAVGAVEIATFEISQGYSFDEQKPLSNATPVEPDGSTRQLQSQASPVVASLRYNPTSSASLDLRTAYDILFNDIRSVSLSANLRSIRHGYLRFSWYINRDLSGTTFDPDPADPSNPFERVFNDASQIRLIGGTAFRNRKITLDLEGSYDIENHSLLDERYRLGYNTQCCGVMMEVARRNFDTIDEVQYRFVLNLRGVGTFLDLQGRPR